MTQYFLIFEQGSIYSSFQYLCSLFLAIRTRYQIISLPKRRSIRITMPDSWWSIGRLARSTMKILSGILMRISEMIGWYFSTTRESWDLELYSQISHIPSPMVRIESLQMVRYSTSLPGVKMSSKHSWDLGIGSRLVPDFLSENSK